MALPPASQKTDGKLHVVDAARWALPSGAMARAMDAVRDESCSRNSHMSESREQNGTNSCDLVAVVGRVWWRAVM